MSRIPYIMNKLTYFAPVVLRVGLSLVFLWFGFSQLVDATQWVAYVPDYAVSLSPFSAITLVHLNGFFEIVFGSLLLLGLFTRFTALLLALHMIDITIIVGLDQTGVRDFAISIATIAVFLNGIDWLSLDRWRRVGPFAARASDIVGADRM